MTSAATWAEAGQAPGDFTSILFRHGDVAPKNQAPEPACFRDLNLDQLVASIIGGREEYELRSYFHVPLTSSGAVAYRHEVLRDLEDAGIRGAVRSFGAGMRSVRGQLEQSRKYHYPVQQRDAFLRAATTYVDAVGALGDGLRDNRPASRGLSSVAAYLESYVCSDLFVALSSDAKEVSTGLASVTYRLHLVGDRVHVSRDVGEENYAADVARTFERFQQGQVESHLARLSTVEEMNHVEAAIAELVGQLYPEAFAALARFRTEHDGFLDEHLSLFDREVQFYLAVLEFADRLRTGGLSMCYPEVSDTGPEIYGQDAFDPALADKLLPDGKSVVCNDFQLAGPERILVVTGPNQGGKTTFARMVGQMTYLAGLGLLVPAGRARLLLPDRILTHFERGENLQDLTGALEDDLVRMRDILHAATARSLVIINEVFTSTSLDDAVLLSTRMLQKMTGLKCLGVWVTFLDELASLSESTVSMVSQVSPDDLTARTFKVVRQRADGTAYAEALAERHGLTYPSLKARLAR